MNDHIDENTDETTDSPAGNVPYAATGVAAMPREDDVSEPTDEASTEEADTDGDGGVPTDSAEPSEAATEAESTVTEPEDVEGTDAGSAEAADDEFAIEVDEDSPFAAAAAIFQRSESESEVSDESEATDEPEPVEATETAEPEAEATDESEPVEVEAADADDADSSDEEAEPADDEAAEPVAESAEASSDGDAGDAAEASADDGDAEGDEEDDEEVLPPASPFDLPGGWYVVHSYSGYENKVKANLSTRIKSMHMEDAIFDIVIPMEEVVEIKSGRKVTVDRKQFPGYILVRMYMDDDSWGVVRNTPGVTGFVGSGTRPTPLSRREVERILGVRKDEEKKAPRFKPDWEVGETVRVIDGPFADFNGIIEDINVDQSKVRVLVDIFGRETPVELNFEQIQKF